MSDRPEWVDVPEPSVRAVDWEPGQLILDKEDVDRVKGGWEGLKTLAARNLADTRSAHIQKEQLVAKGSKDAFILHGVLADWECRELIDACNAKQFIPALVNIGGGRQQYIPDYRSGLRCIVDSPEFAQLLQARVAGFLPEHLGDSKHHRGPERLHSVNERMRVLCYHEPDNRFEEHFDGCFVHPVTKAHSVYTLQIYLNSIPDAELHGGGTAFTRDRAVCTPKMGSVLCFTQNLAHEGQPLKTGGIKYTLRTEAMYKRDD